ncbi:MAG: hemolysin family protein [Bacteroidales bacterium]
MSPISGIAIAIAVSAFFSGIEIAFVSSNKLRFELDKKQKGLSASILNLFYSNSENFISTLLVGNNIALVVYGMLMAKVLEPTIRQFVSIEGFVVFIQTIISTILILVAAEFLPKTIFRINPNFSIKLFAVPLLFIYIILYPISKFATLMSKLILRLTGIKVSSKAEKYVFGKIDLDYFVNQSIDDTLDNSEVDTEVKIFRNALDFSNIKLRNCMVPRTELSAVEWDTPHEKLLAEFIDSGYSKILVFRSSIDNIVGYIHSSELFSEPRDWHTRINQISIVPETMAAHKLMKHLMQQKKSIAVVVDEHGGTSGIVTLEDLLEEIIGEIEDEHDTPSLVARKSDSGDYILSGRCEISHINEKFDIIFPESEDYSTVAGYILNRLERLPSTNEIIELPPFSIKILKATSTKIELVKVHKMD